MAKPHAWVFAVEDTSMQVCWRNVPGAATRAGALDLSGLTPDTEYPVELAGVGAGTVRTLSAPPGAELYRFATVNDVHIGEKAFGLRRNMRETGAALPYPQRCLRAALAEARAWGAQRILVKGDLTDEATVRQLGIAADELLAVDLPIDIVLGNHDVHRRGVDAAPVLRSRGLPVATEPTVIDVPGLRIILLPTARRGEHGGHVSAIDRAAVVEMAAHAPGAVFVATHHYPQRWRVANVWPAGIPGPEAQTLLDELAEANPAVVFASGHSHRHRRHQHGPMPVAEIGSTKDYPGAWAGYVVHEGGIRQVVRRVAEPSAIAWTDRTRAAVGGVWGWWAPGLRSHRCWSWTWPLQG